MNLAVELVNFTKFVKLWNSWQRDDANMRLRSRTICSHLANVGKHVHEKIMIIIEKKSGRSGAQMCVSNVGLTQDCKTSIHYYYRGSSHFSCKIRLRQSRERAVESVVQGHPSSFWLPNQLDSLFGAQASALQHPTPT